MGTVRFGVGAAVAGDRVTDWAFGRTVGRGVRRVRLSVGRAVGRSMGRSVGAFVGGPSVGRTVEAALGSTVGAAEVSGLSVGTEVGPFATVELGIELTAGEPVR